MPLDLLVVILPALLVVLLLVLTYVPKVRRQLLVVEGVLLAIFLLIYFAPGWLLMIGANRGDTESQFLLSNWYATRLGYNWPNIEASQYWLKKAAEQKHPKAMCCLG